jgi:DNA-binding CsgD family transcriptional regulator
MIHDISKLQAITIWTSDDYYIYSYYLELRKAGLNLFYCRNNEAVNKLVTHFMSEAQKLISKKLCKGFKLQIKFENKTIWFSSQDNSNAFQPNLIENKICNGEIQNQRIFFDTLTKKEKNILIFMSRNYKQDTIAFAHNIGIETLKTHRKNIYRKMNFSSKSDLIVWSEKYLDYCYSK